MSKATTDTERHWAKIEAYLTWLAANAPDGLRRVVEGERWCVRHLGTAAGERCLVGHAEDWRWPQAEFLTEFDLFMDAPAGAGHAFDTLAQTIGLAPLVSAVQQRAADLLRPATLCARCDRAPATVPGNHGDSYCEPCAGKVGLL